MGFRVAPGVRISAGSRGMRVGVGPRAARVHVGTGRAGISSGLGPFSTYSSIGGSRRRSRGPSRTSVSAYERQLRQQQRVQQVQAQLEVDKAFMSEFLLAHQENFEPPPRPLAAEPQPVQRKPILAAHRKREREGIGFWKFSERRDAKAKADELAEQEFARLIQERHAAYEREQAELDRAYQSLLDGDEEAVLATLEAAFEDNQAPAAAIGFDDGALSLIVRLPPVDGLVPESKATTTPTGCGLEPRMRRADR
jgi:hypothetical protein